MPRHQLIDNDALWYAYGYILQELKFVSEIGKRFNIDLNVQSIGVSLKHSCIYIIKK